MKVALLQIDVQIGQVKENQNKVKKYLKEAADLGAEIAVLPELWNTGYALGQIKQLAETKSGESITLLRKIAREHHMYIFAGSIMEKKEGRYHNTCFVIDHNGNIIETYRKVHLFSLGLLENKVFTAGDEWILVDTPWLKTGVLLCYDLRFPEFCRNLALRGAQMLIIPAQWPEVRIEHWQLLCRARAIENQCFVLACNTTGEGESPYRGSSMIISPLGEVLADASNQERILFTDLNIEELDGIKEKIDIFSDRKQILDEIDDSQV